MNTTVCSQVPINDTTIDALSTVCVVILNWNQPELTAECLAHVLGQHEAVSVLVVDNGSRPDAAAQVAAACAGRCDLIRLDRNLGFAAGMNVGIQHAAAQGSEFVWLLNNDTFPERECLPILLAAALADPTLAMLTPRLHGTDEKEQHAGGAINWGHGTLTAASAETLADPGVPNGWLTGTALLCRTKAVAAVGGFDPLFYAYWEEVDLCVRLRAQGHRLRAVPEARCLHLGSASTGGGASPYAMYMIARNRWLFLRKHIPAWRWPVILPRLVAAGLIEIVIISRKQPDVGRAILGGLLAGAAGQTGRTTAAWAPPEWLAGPLLATLDRLARATNRGVAR